MITEKKSLMLQWIDTMVHATQCPCSLREKKDKFMMKFRGNVNAHRCILMMARHKIYSLPICYIKFNSKSKCYRSQTNISNNT